MAVRRSWGITLALSTLLMSSTVGLPTALAATAPAPVTPTAPVLSAPRVGVDGVALTWTRAYGSPAGSEATSYVIHRLSAGNDRDWEVATCCDPTWSSNDTTIPTGATATYTVVARNAAGDSPASNPQTVTVPTWNGPFTPANRSLALVWDGPFAITGDNAVTVQVPAGASPGLEQIWGGGATTQFATAASASSTTPMGLNLQTGLSDGTYQVGSDPGQVRIQATAGLRCDLPSSGGTPGTATISHAAPSLSGGYASVTVDAVLSCLNGHTLHAYLRWQTPDPTVGLTTAPLTVTQADPGTQSTVEVAVRNTGDLPVTLGAASLSATYTTSTDPLSVVASTCEGVTLAPGSQCSVTVQYTAGAVNSHEGNDFLNVASDVGGWQLGRVVGQQPPFWSGAQNLAFSSSPGHVDLSWSSPWTGEPFDHWRVDDLTTGTSPVGGQNLGRTRTDLSGLSVGPHSLQVVLVTTDGREIKAAPLPVTLPQRWLLSATPNGVRAYDPDGATTNGGLLGGIDPLVSSPVTVPMESVVASPDRNGVFVERSQLDISHYDAKGSLLGFVPAGFTASVVADEQLTISPDGSRIAVLRPQLSGATTRPASIVVMPTVSGVATTVPNSEDLSSPSWTADGRALVASVGGSALARVDPTTGTRTPIPGTTGASLVAVSRTGRMAFRLGGPGAGGEVRVTGPSGGASTVLGVQDGATSLAWDPTGRWLAVTSPHYDQPWTTAVYDTQSSTPLVRTVTGGGTSVAWLDTASLAPSVSLTSPAWTTSSASVAVTASDPDDAVGGLRRECELDGGTWGPCSDPWTLTNLTAGTHTVQARATDPSGQQSPVVSRSWQVDSAAPTAAIAPLPWVPSTTAPVLSWSGADTGGSGLGSFQIRERAGTLNGPIGGYQYPSVWAVLTGRSMTLRVAPGMQYCFSVRARDVAGNVGAWSAERCTSIAVDDRALTASSGWTRGLSSAALYGTWSRGTRAGSTLSRPSVQGRRIAVIATTCSTCGAVDVYHAGVWLGRVSLSTPTTQYRQVRWLPLEPITRLGAVVLKTVTAAPVYVDAIAAAH